MTNSRVAIVFGTYNRLPLLKSAIASVRQAVGTLPYEIVVIDGGSTDGSREWLAVQPDVVLIGQRGSLTGAVKAFNLGFSYAVENAFDFVMHLNDDAEIVTKNGIEEAVNLLKSNPKIGEVAFAFDLYGGWSFDHVNGKPYANFGVIRREAGEAVAKAQGDPNGKAWWNPIYKTYGADSEFGVWLWKLGWEVSTATDLRVHDVQAMDALRISNDATNPDRLDSKIFWDRWRNENYQNNRLELSQPPKTEINKGNVLVTGSSGFLGTALTKRLKQDLTIHLSTFRSDQIDLRDKKATQRLFSATRPRIVYHLAARCGGIGANQKNPTEFFQDNMEMGMNVLEAARDHNVDKVIIVGTVCSYPNETPIPFKEIDLWNGYPEETNAPYGVAKRALGVLAKAYKDQFNLNSVIAILANLYGPGDNFDLETSHVIPAMIRKFIEAGQKGQKEITLWGTGNPTREFLFVEDAARALKLIADHNVVPNDPINVGTGQSISIADLATMIAKIIGFDGTIRWDHSRPDGQPKRALSVMNAQRIFGFSATETLLTGLERTIEWYKNKK